MMYLSLWLTIFVLITVVLIMRVIRVIAGRSGSYFVKQQQSLGDVNGYIEEMVNGLKVVKVFNYEAKAKEAFDVKINSFVKMQPQRISMPIYLCRS